jgi:hypothetical protein
MTVEMRKVETQCLARLQVAPGHGGTWTYKKRTLVPFNLPSDVCMTFCIHISAASAGIRCKYRPNADVPFILHSPLNPSSFFF